jgi:hypothetical protein
MEKKKNWLGILVIVLVFGITVVGCDNSTNDTTSNSESVQVTASSGEISINYNGGIFPIGMNVVVTTNLPAPNNSYTFGILSPHLHTTFPSLSSIDQRIESF